MTGTLETVDGRPALRFERRLAHRPERVWRAITEPAELERWFVVSVAWTPAPGEVFEVDGVRGEITELAPPSVLAWSFGGDDYRFDLRPDGDGCLLVFLHVLQERGRAAQTAAGWDTYLDRLEVHLAGRFISEEEAHRCWPERHERYQAEFDGAGSPAPALPATLEEGPTLRFERRYAHPVERVWRAITDPDELRHWFPSGEAMLIEESVAPRLLTGRWYADELRFELRADGDGCVLSFTHALADRATAARDAAGWERCLARLDALLAGAPMSEADSLSAWPEAHERYAQRFGVDPELGRSAFAGHPLT